MDLQNPESKMSTTGGTEAGLVYIDDEPEDIVKKVKRAQTDSGSEVVRGPDKAGITNLIEIYAVARGVDPDGGRARVRGPGLRRVQAERGRGAWPSCSRPCGSATASCGPNPDAIEAALRQGADRAREIAVPTMAEVHSVMGLGTAVDARYCPAHALKKCLVIPITRRMKALDRPLARPLLIVLMAAVLWTMWATDFGVHL